MKTAQIMTRKPVSVTPQTTILDAAELMLQHHISGLPVTDGNDAVVGIVTEGDMLRRAEIGTERQRAPWLAFLIGPGRLAGDYVDAHARKVGEVMTSDVAVVDPADDLADVVSLMEKRHIKRVPVVENGKMVGIVSRADLVRALVRTLTQQAMAVVYGVPPDDDVIRKCILDTIAKEPWGPRFSIDITVESGVVDLRGSVTDERERTAIVVAAENVAGVTRVRDHLVWVEPTSGLVIGADETR
jgi:CBS domain-containing protein